jgi:hypothetical protein
MLPIYFLQHWFNLSDPTAEEALYDSPVMRRFAGVDLGRAPAPDETTILNFRHLLERHDLSHAGCGQPLPGGMRHPHRHRHDVADKHMLADLLHGAEGKAWGDGAYRGQAGRSAKARRSPGYDLAADTIWQGRG